MAAPAPIVIEKDFGVYRAGVEMSEDGTLRYVRTLTMTSADLPAAQYDAYRTFVAEIVKADRVQVVLVKK